MDRTNFENAIREIATQKPQLFALDSDNKAAIEMIDCVEKYYNIKLPDDYKEFIKLYGGGYFGFIVVYSCDAKGMFYIRDKVSKDWISQKLFLPVVDLETGDYIGFPIKDGRCQKEVAIYSHDEDMFQVLETDFYGMLLKYGLKYN